MIGCEQSKRGRYNVFQDAYLPLEEQTFSKEEEVNSLWFKEQANVMDSEVNWFFFVVDLLKRMSFLRIVKCGLDCCLL